jgi:uncharacterized protein (TIGR02757 family)
MSSAIVLDDDLTRTLLNDLYDRFDHRFISPDPLECVRRLDRPEDKETAAFIAAVFAYGRADLIVQNIEGILDQMDRKPYEFLFDFEPKRMRTRFRKFRYRFNDRNDLFRLFTVLREALRKHGNLENGFMTHYRPDHPDVGPALTGFIHDMLAGLPNGKTKRKASFEYLLPDPARGSACKRLHLFLRWMVRSDSVDLGLWKHVPASKLLIPLDTHVFRILTNLGLIRSKTANWKQAVAVTEKLREFDPVDPVKYDFAICSYGKLGYCVRNRVPEKCDRCDLQPICSLC